MTETPRYGEVMGIPFLITFSKHKKIIWRKSNDGRKKTRTFRKGL